MRHVRSFGEGHAIQHVGQHGRLAASRGLAAYGRKAPVTVTLCRMGMKRTFIVLSHSRRLGSGKHLAARWGGTSRARWAQQTVVACQLSAALALQRQFA